MTEIELYKEIVRAVRDIQESQIAAAVAKVRALCATYGGQPSSPARAERGGKNRMFSGGMDRSLGGDDAE